MSGTDFSPEFRAALQASARLLQQHRPGEAVEQLKPLYEQAPDHPDVAINLSGAYILQNKWHRAIAVLDRAIQAHPTNAMLWSNLGAAQLGRLETAGPRQQEKAIAAYQQALQADSEAPNVHYHLGLIYKERGELTRAAAMFQRALEVNPADRDARTWLDRLAGLIVEEQRAKRQSSPLNAADAETRDDTGVNEA